MLDEIRKEFINYSKNFNLKDKNIMRKFHHSFRVMEFAHMITKSINLTDSDTEIVLISALLHDIARFEQWTNYKTYNDSDSIDHGDRSYEIIKKLKLLDGLEDYQKEIILKSVKNHNKYKIEEGLNEKELLVAKIVRDADKLDIIKEQCNMLCEEIDNINDDIIKCILEEKLVNNNLVNKEHEHLIRMISFIFDLNFDYSFKYLYDNKIIENKINLLKIYSKDEKVNYIEEKIMDYIKEKIVC
jgi:HD superfamily phosphodiesterase